MKLADTSGQRTTLQIARIIMSRALLRPFPAWVKHTGQRLAALLATLSPKEKNVRLRDGDEDLVISWPTGLVPVGQGSSSHRGGHFHQQKARKVDGGIGALSIAGCIHRRSKSHVYVTASPPRGLRMVPTCHIASF